MLKNVTRIVGAYVGNHVVAPQDLPLLINTVRDALAAPAKPEVESPAPLPAVSIRKSVLPDEIICMCCGESLKMLKRHLNTEHDLTVDEYKAMWGLRADYPMVAPNYAAERSRLAKLIGLGRKPGAAKAPPAKAARGAKTLKLNYGADKKK